MPHSHAKHRFGLVFLFAIAAVLCLLPETAKASFPGIVGQYIAFQSNREGDNEIYTSLVGNPTMATKLTNNTAKDEVPVWSPDGTKIVFHSDRDGNLEIYSMNADGSGQTRLTNNAAFDELPAWSPDGTKIVFDSGRDDSHGEIYTMNANGTGVTRLTNDPGYDFGSTWSPDGTKIAWQSSRNAGQYDIYSMNADGTGQTNLTNNTSAQDIQPDWTPDGSKIGFATNRTANQYDIWWVNPNGTGQAASHAPNNASLDEVNPAFQPDFQTISGTPTGGILYTRYTAGNTFSDIYRLGQAYSNGSSLGAVDEASDWQPVNRSYARPRGATPVRIALVPGYQKCVPPSEGPPGPNHRGTISQPSCYGPLPEATGLTVGSPDFNGAGANSIGFVLFRVRTAAPEDGLITVNLTDVRVAGSLADYTGNLGFETIFRITDKNNGPTGIGPSANGTVTDLPFTFSFPCSATGSATVGSTCSAATSINSVLGGGAVTAGKLAIWEMIAGPDGRVIKVGNGFAVSGLFFP
jgi:Tol biopolymer transport system component